MITLPHAVFIYDEAGNPVPVVSGSTLNSGSRGFVIYGKDGSNQTRNFTVDASGNLAIQNPSNLDVTVSSRFNTLGQKTMTGSTPVVIASNQTEFPVSQGTSASLAAAWSVKVTDGTNVHPTMDAQTRAGFCKITDGVNNVVTVKTGSALAAAADNSLVVQISPNQQPIPTQLIPETSTPGNTTGRSPSLANNTLTAIRTTTYVGQTTNAQRSFVSTSANDSSAGTGARQIKLTYYNSSGAGPFTETLSTNGLTAVNTTATDICFVEKIEVTSVGSNGSNVGTINMYSTTGAGGTIIAAIGVANLGTGVGDNTTLYGHHYVASGSVVNLYNLNCGAQTSFAQVFLKIKDPTVTTSAETLIGDIMTINQNTFVSRKYDAKFEFTGPKFITAYAIAGANNTIVTVSFDWSEQTQ